MIVFPFDDLNIPTDTKTLIQKHSAFYTKLLCKITSISNKDKNMRNYWEQQILLPFKKAYLEVFICDEDVDSKKTITEAVEIYLEEKKKCQIFINNN